MKLSKVYLLTHPHQVITVFGLTAHIQPPCPFASGWPWLVAALSRDPSAGGLAATALTTATLIPRRTRTPSARVSGTLT